MSENKRFSVEHKTNAYYNDKRATVGALKKVLDNFDDGTCIGVKFDDGLAYTDINEVFELDDKYDLIIINCD